MARTQLHLADEGYDIWCSPWLDVEPDPGQPELEDKDIPIPTESPFVTRMRNAPGGPYILAPDSTAWVPPNSLAVPAGDLHKVMDNVIAAQEELERRREVEMG